MASLHHSQSEMNSHTLTPAALSAAIENKFQISLTESTPVLARETDRYCATLSLQTATPPFVNRRTFTLEIDFSSSEKTFVSVTPDNHFLRMTTLYDGTAKDANAIDLIVVPGLSSHPFGSFKSPLVAGENWLRDYLPQILPNIRVLVYGYDSRLLQYEGKESILDFAKGLLESIHSHRGDPVASSRPVIFLGHSLGGLLIKEALAIARDETNRTSKDEQFFKVCYGLIFFGVPNLGLRNEELLTTVIGKRPSERLIRDLIVDQ
ncbi:hypothetical protein MMC28_009721, partial [Mycoblastus sanguinarius]|nr:hypothetical protein [Mycoblastus sanguinarius]